MARVGMGRIMASKIRQVGGRCGAGPGGYFRFMESTDPEVGGHWVSRADLARWSGLPERHPLVGLFHRFGGVRDLNSAYEQLAHLSSHDFVDEVFQHLGVRLELAPEDLARIPQEGPFILSSNHPFGILDALALIRLVQRARPDFMLGVEAHMAQIPALASSFCVVSEQREGGRTVPLLSGWRSAAAHLDRGGAFGVFPSGAVSSYRRASRLVADGRWSDSVVGWMVKQDVPVVPVYIDGANSPLFQLLGLIHPSLRSLRVAAELRNKKGHVLRMRVGRPLRKGDLTGFGGTEQLARFLRAKSYALGAAYEVRREHFRPFRFPKRAEDIAPPVSVEALVGEVAGMEEHLLFRHPPFEVYAAPARRMPHLLQEIGRCREWTFRAVGEGTNRALDLDEHDYHYRHLILWDAEASRLAGAYRIGEGWIIMERFGVRGFYTHSLFRMKKGFHPVLRSAIELGRSFIHPDYQKQRMPLFLLWKGILTVLVQSPEARYIIGPVTISSDYQRFSRALIMAFVRKHYWDERWARMIRPRKRFAFEEKRVDADALIEGAGDDVKRLDKILADIEPSHAVAPVLLKKYLLQNARILGFNRDPLFNDALDGLMLLDVNDLPAETVSGLQKEFGLGV